MPIINFIMFIQDKNPNISLKSLPLIDNSYMSVKLDLKETFSIFIMFH